MAVTLQIIGADEAMRMVGKVASAASDLTRPMTQALTLLHSDLATYPPEPPGSTYRRTGTLGRAWTHKISDRGHTGKVVNNVAYAPYVQAAEFQAQQHQDRWLTDREALENREDEILSLFRKHIYGEIGD